MCCWLVMRFSSHDEWMGELLSVGKLRSLKSKPTGLEEALNKFGERYLGIRRYGLDLDL